MIQEQGTETTNGCKYKINGIDILSRLKSQGNGYQQIKKNNTSVRRIDVTVIVHIPNLQLTLRIWMVCNILFINLWDFIQFIL